MKPSSGKASSSASVQIFCGASTAAFMTKTLRTGMAASSYQYSAYRLDSRISVNSQARAQAHHRLAVGSEMPRIGAASAGKRSHIAHPALRVRRSARVVANNVLAFMLQYLKHW